MTIRLRGLLDADTGRLHQIARRWDRVALALDTAVEDLGRDNRDLPHHWPAGPSSQAAQDRLADLRVRIGTGHVHCAAIAALVREFAGSVEDNRRLLHGIVSEAEQRGLRIDLRSGTITAPIEMPAGQAAVDSYVAQIGEVLARVNEDDRRFSEWIGDHKYHELDLPGPGRPQYDEVSVLALAGLPAPDQARWWQAQHPLVQDRAIVEHPEIVGAAAGLPAKDRDSANRLLLRRDREELEAGRAAHEQLHDGAMSPALLAVDRRLAALDDLERRARGQRLLTYTRGAESESQLVKR